MMETLFRAAASQPLCTSCGDHPLEETVTLCGACVVPTGVSAFCRGCRTHLRYSSAQARPLFCSMGKDEAYARPGVVVVFLERCPLCGDATAAAEYPQRVLVAELRHDTSVTQ